MVSAIISKVVMMVFGTLYPAYRSYKAVKNKDVREYVKWMMYWIIFAFFITAETFADMFLSWLPLYYEIKIVFIIWLLSPATKGSSILYRRFVHPRLQKHEKNIDRYISQAQKSSYATLMDVGRKGLNVATDTLVKTAVTGQSQLIQTLRKYNSMQELNSVGMDNTDATSSSRPWYNALPPTTASYDPEDDVDVLQRQYKSPAAEHIAEEQETSKEFLRSQSAVNMSRNIPEEAKVSEDTVDSSASQNNPIDYSYSSNTLPRSRKSKKPLYQTLQSTKPHRTRRNNDKKPTN